MMRCAVSWRYWATVAISAGLLFAGGGARGATQYLDAGGGAVAWDAATAAWGSASGGPYAGVWTNGNSAVFEGTTGAVTAAAVSAAGLEFAAGGYLLLGGPLTLADGATIQGSATIQAGLSVPVSGNRFRVTGDGTLTLGGKVGYGGALQANVTMDGAGTLILGDNATALDNDNLGLTVNRGTVILNKPAGALRAVGNNLTLNGGLLQLAGSGGDQIYVNVAPTINGGTFDLNGRSEAIGALNGAGGVILNNGDATTATLTIGGNGAAGAYAGSLLDRTSGAGILALTKTGAGRQVLTGNNTYSGITTVNGGSLQLGDGGTTGTLGTNTVNLVTGGAFHYSRLDALTVSNKFSTGVIVVNTGTLTLAGATDNNSVTATVRSGATLILAKQSAGAVHALGTANTGLTIETNATVRVGGPGNDQIYTQLDVVNDGLLDLAGHNEGFDGLTGAGRIVNDGSAATNVLTIGENNAGSVFTGTLSGPLSLTKNGSGALLLGNTNTYSGATQINGGAVVLSNGVNRLPVTTTLTLANTAGVGLDLAGHDQRARWLAGGGATGGVVTNSAAAPVTLRLDLQASATRTFSGAIGGALRVVVQNAVAKNTDVQVFARTNTFTCGLVIDNGQVRVASEAFLGAAPTAFELAHVTLQNGGVLQNNDSHMVIGTNRGIFLAGGDGVIYTGWGKSITNYAAISGPGRLVKSDSGLLALFAACTFGGDTVFRNPGVGTGTIRLSHPLALQYSTFDATGINGNGTLNLNNLAAVLGGLKGGGATINNFTGAVTLGNNDKDVTFTGNLAGAGSLTKIGTGTQVLSGGGIAYTGNTTVNSGRLVLSNCTAYARGTSSADLAIAADAVLEFNVGAGVTHSIGSTATNTITGTGTLRKTGAGMLALDEQGSAAYKVVLGMTGGLIDIQAGTLRNGGFTGQDWTGNLAPLHIAAGATFDVWDGAPVYVDALTGEGAVAKNQGNGATRVLTVGVNNGSGTFNGVFTNALPYLGLAKTGTGTQVLAGAAANTFNGPTTVSAGELHLNKPAGVDALGAGVLTANGGTVKLLAANQINDGAGLTATNSGLVNLNGCDETVGWLAGGGGRITTGGGPATLGLDLKATGVHTFTGQLDGALRLVVKNASRKNTDVQVFAAVQNFTGGLVLDNGQLRAATDSYFGAVPAALDPANITLMHAGVLQNNDSDLVLNASRGIVLGAGGGAFASGWVKTITVNGPISGPGGLIKTDGGTLILTAANTFEGDTVFNQTLLGQAPGTLRLDHALALQNSTVDATGVGATGTLDLNGRDAVLGGLKGGGAAIQGFMGRVSIGNNNQGTTYTGALGGTGALRKIGTGTLTLAMNPAYNGETTVDGGTLLVNGSHTVGAAYTVNAGTLGGNGTIGSAVTVRPGGALAPGGTNAAARLTVNGSVTLAEGATFAVDIRGAAVGTEYDQLANGGAGELRLENATLVIAAPEDYVPANGTIHTIASGFAVRKGVFAGLPEGAEVAAGRGAYAVHYGPGNDITLTGREVARGMLIIVQ